MCVCQISTSVRGLITPVTVTAVLIWWARIAVNAEPASSSTALADPVRVSAVG